MKQWFIAWLCRRYGLANISRLRVMVTVPQNDGPYRLPVVDMMLDDFMRHQAYMPYGVSLKLSGEVRILIREI